MHVSMYVYLVCTNTLKVQNSDKTQTQFPILKHNHNGSTCVYVAGTNSSVDGAVGVAFFEVPTCRCAPVDQLAKTQQVDLALNSEVPQLILT